MYIFIYVCICIYIYMYIMEYVTVQTPEHGEREYLFSF